MVTERTSGGDPGRTLQLLWRTTTNSQHGPRRGLSVDIVVEAATALADAEGLAALTMRRVAQTLGVVPMTLYTYVPAKAELIDLMVDAAYQAMPRAETSSQPWRERVTAIANENKRLFEQHPWVAAVSTARPPLGPGQMAKYEHELSALDGLGLDDVTMDDCLTYLLTFIQASARATADARPARHDSAMDDQAWWEANAPLFAQVFDEHAYPTAARVGAAAGAAHGSAYDPQHAYNFGLQRVLDSLNILIQRHNDKASPHT